MKIDNLFDEENRKFADIAQNMINLAKIGNPSKDSSNDEQDNQ